MDQKTEPALAAKKAGIERINQTLTSHAERRVLNWLCARMPRAVTSDMLTFLGVVGAVLTFAGFFLSDRSVSWLWLAIAGLVLNWLGDSLDGSLARYRGTERPRYGFFLDHMADTFVMALVAVGVTTFRSREERQCARCADKLRKMDFAEFAAFAANPAFVPLAARGEV